MTTDLRHGLSDLADQAPRTLAAGDLWAEGKSRQRRRRLQGALVAAVAVVLVGGLATLVLPSSDEGARPAVAPTADLHLPRTVNPPSPWSEGTDEAGAPGPLAVVSVDLRYETKGLTGRRESSSFYGISAVDGSARFLDLPGAYPKQGDLGAYGSALSPDGTKVGYPLIDLNASEESNALALKGWGIYDTVTGKTRMLKVPGRDFVIVDASFEMRFSGDSRYLMTSYSPEGQVSAKSHQLVAWDVESGESTIVEAAGHRGPPNPGSAPTGIVWSRGTRTLTFDPDTGTTTTSVTAPKQAMDASYGPDGHALVFLSCCAKKARGLVLFAGRDAGSVSPVDLDINPDMVLGWRDAAHVVISNGKHAVRIVDVTTGEVSAREKLSWPSDQGMRPVFAADMWANSLVDGTTQDKAGDPRWWVRTPAAPWALGIGGLAVLALGLVLIRRRRHVRP